MMLSLRAAFYNYIASRSNSSAHDNVSTQSLTSPVDKIDPKEEYIKKQLEEASKEEDEVEVVHDGCNSQGIKNEPIETSKNDQDDFVMLEWSCEDKNDMENDPTKSSFKKSFLYTSSFTNQEIENKILEASNDYEVENECQNRQRFTPI